jgi:hypothetical protein
VIFTLAAVINTPIHAVLVLVPEFNRRIGPHDGKHSQTVNHIGYDVNGLIDADHPVGGVTFYLKYLHQLRMVAAVDRFGPFFVVPAKMSLAIIVGLPVGGDAAGRILFKIAVSDGIGQHLEGVGRGNKPIGILKQGKAGNDES